MEPNRYVALAVSTGRVGFVCLTKDGLIDWGISKKAARNGTEAACYAETLIARYQPDVLVLEHLRYAAKKGAKSAELSEAIARVAADHLLFDVSVKRPHRFANKYVEADYLVQRYPELKPWLPRKRRFFETEPWNMVLFEAVVLGLEAIG
jgi:hypothetical protein